jgi:hypothetical protein
MFMIFMVVITFLAVAVMTIPMVFTIRTPEEIFQEIHRIHPFSIVWLKGMGLLLAPRAAVKMPSRSRGSVIGMPQVIQSPFLGIAADVLRTDDQIRRMTDEICGTWSGVTGRSLAGALAAIRMVLDDARDGLFWFFSLRSDCTLVEVKLSG